MRDCRRWDRRGCGTGAGGAGVSGALAAGEKHFPGNRHLRWGRHRGGTGAGGWTAPDIVGIQPVTGGMIRRRTTFNISRGAHRRMGLIKGKDEAAEDK